MKEVKFRAWDKRNKQMNKVWAIDYQINEVELSDKFDGYWTKFEDVILLQYTGNNDKKDVEIYENDIVEDEYNRKYVVVFKGDCWRCEPLSKGLRNRWISNHLMVVGNVYSSPELLEEITK